MYSFNAECDRLSINTVAPTTRSHTKIYAMEYVSLALL